MNVLESILGDDASDAGFDEKEKSDSIEGKEVTVMRSENHNTIHL